MRKPKPRISFGPSYALVVDGETEVWYFQMMKQYEEKNRKIRINVKPEIPQNKTLEGQFELVKELAGSEYNRVFWIVDLDTIQKETREAKRGKEAVIKTFIQLRQELLDNHKNVCVIVNNPCLEYWYLLHFKSIVRQFDNCSKVEEALSGYIHDYQKTERFFKKDHNDIYTRLRPHLIHAIENSKRHGDFDIDNPEKAMCQMHDFFTCEELQTHFKVN